MPNGFHRIAALAVVAAAGLNLVACRGEPEPVQNQVVTTLPRDPLPIAEPPMDRAQLLRAFAEAASSAALGSAPGPASPSLDGKRFEVRLRFGCAPTGPDEDPKDLSVRFDPKTKSLRMRAAPNLSLDDPLAAAMAGEGVEAVEGFWLRRPWLLTDGCPAQPPAAAKVETGDEEPAAAPKPTAKPSEPVTPATKPPTAPVQRFGLAQFFTADDARSTQRNGRAYEATKVLVEGQATSTAGYTLVLSGRLQRRADGRVIMCQRHGPERAPDCIASVRFDRVWIERPDNREVIAEWGH